MMVHERYVSLYVIGILDKVLEKFQKKNILNINIENQIVYLFNTST